MVRFLSTQRKMGFLQDNNKTNIMNFWDIETLINFFSAIFINEKLEEKIFIIFKGHDQRKELLSFIKTKVPLIGFNSHKFDHQVIEFMLQNERKHDFLSTEEVITDIYNFVQKLIYNQNKENSFPPYFIGKFTNPSIDIMKTLHLDGKAKMSSLKWCEFSMDWENLQDMPIHHSTYINESQIKEILDYNRNDVLATKELFDRHRGHVGLRKELTKAFGIDLLSASEPRIAKEIFGKYLCEAMGITKKELMALPKDIDTVNIGELILPNVKFETPQFQEVLDYFKSLTVNVEDNSINDELSDYDNLLAEKKVRKQIKIGDCIVDYALGGIHGCYEKPTIFEEDDKHIIMSLDAKSFYPHFNFIYGIRPIHLPEDIFNPIYKDFYVKREVIPKKDPLNYVFKLLLNGSYGLSKERNSFLYYPPMTLGICVNGQLMLSMLFERLQTIGKVILLNTDGGELLLEKKHLDKYFEICKEWEKETGFILEHEQYKKLVIRDVNNYIGVFTNGKVKYKGAFEFNDLPVHKDKSMLIVPKALSDYFINSIPVDKTIRSCDNIYDFCKAVKSKGGAKFYTIDPKTNIKEAQQKVNRYFVSKQGKFLIKELPKLETKVATNQINIFGEVNDGSRISQVEAHHLITIANKKPVLDKENINYEYYIQECNKIIKQFQ